MAGTGWTRRTLARADVARMTIARRGGGARAAPPFRAAFTAPGDTAVSLEIPRSPAMRNLLPLVLLAALAGCGGAPDRDTEQAVAAPTAAPPAPASPISPSASVPAPASLFAQTGLAGFSGYGGLTFGIAAADMEEAWGGALEAPGPVEDAAACHYLRPKRGSRSDNDPWFMVEGGKFVRYDIRADTELAPGGGKIGMRKDELLRLYAGKVEEQPHKYTDGQYLRIEDPAGGKGVLVFETDGKDADSKALRWRIGVAPQVDYVEGCS
jgi:hypothetical protein